MGETERAWGDREKERRDEEGACGVDVDCDGCYDIATHEQEGW